MKKGFTITEVLISLVIAAIFFVVLYMITSFLLKNSMGGYAQGIITDKLLNANYEAWSNTNSEIQTSQLLEALETSPQSFVEEENINIIDASDDYESILTTLEIEDQIKVLRIEFNTTQKLSRKFKVIVPLFDWK